MTQSKIILSVLKDAYPNWIPSYEFVNRDTKYGYLGPTGRRRCQELAQEGRIERREGKHIGLNPRFVYYRWLPPMIPQQPMVTLSQPKLINVRAKG